MKKNKKTKKQKMIQALNIYSKKQHRKKYLKVKKIEKKQKYNAIVPSATSINKGEIIGEIDSLNVSSPILLTMFLRDADIYNCYKIDLKSKSDNTLWMQTFGKFFTNKVNGRLVAPFKELYIIYCRNTDIILPLKVLAKKQDSFTLEFSGLHGYNERSERLKLTLKNLYSDIKYTNINRIDIALDVSNTNYKIFINRLIKDGKRQPYTYKKSTYFNTEKQKNKRNQYINIVGYNKAKQLGIYSEIGLMRLEFQFGLEFFRYTNFQLEDMRKAIKKMEKSLSRILSNAIRINRQLPLYVNT